MAISGSLNPTNPILRLGNTWASVTWKRLEKCFLSWSLENVGGRPETNTLEPSMMLGDSDTAIFQPAKIMPLKSVEASRNFFFILPRNSAEGGDEM